MLVFKSSSEIITSANSISPILSEISYAYESFRRFLHSENTRSDAFALVILYCIFQWDVTAITSDEPFLVLCEILQFRYCQPGEEPYCNFPFQKSGSYQKQLKIHSRNLSPLVCNCKTSVKDSNDNFLYLCILSRGESNLC